MTRKERESPDQDPAYRPYKREVPKKRRRKSPGQLNCFSWSPAEQSLYVEFLKNNKNLFANIEERKKSKVFVQMTLFIKKRGPDQCRSHHQKMSIKYGSIDQIIQRVTVEKIENLKQPKIEESKEEKESELENLCFENDSEIQEMATEKQQGTMVSIVSPSSMEQEDQLWYYLDNNVWINE